MKQVYKGWMPNRITIDKEGFWELLHGYDIFPNRGCRDDYYSEDWPPVKVLVTVEVDNGKTS